MTPEVLLLTLVGVLVVVYACVAFAAYLRVRGPRLVLPEAEQPWVYGEAGHAVVADRAEGSGGLRDDLAHAGRTAAAANTDGGAILRRWFAGKACTICEKTIPPIHRIEQHPGLMTSDHDVITWEQIVHDEQLTASLESHLPVCANCLMAETFRRQFPELVLDRPEHGRN